jgi:hypothetical protein
MKNEKILNNAMKSREFLANIAFNEHHEQTEREWAVGMVSILDTLIEQMKG